MKSKLAFFLLIIGLFTLPVTVGAQDVGSMNITCDIGANITNGIPVTIVQLRAGFDYTATAIGIDGFDPVLAVIGENGDGLCNDDSRDARGYEADLPTTGVVPASSFSSQITFNHDDSSGFQDIDLVVGGLNNQVGEFLLVLEGMGITAADNAGDPFIVTLTQSMINSGAPLDVYMIARTGNGVDPSIYALDSNGEIMVDRDDLEIYCDDAGSDLCYGGSRNSVDLSNSYVSTTDGLLGGFNLDSYITLDVSGVTLSDDPDENGLMFLMSSYEGTQGQYVVVFRMGLGEETARPGK